MSSKKHLARVLAVAAMSALTLTLAACGDDEEEGSGTASGGQTAADGDRPAWCGDKEITFALADGFAANNWRRITTAEAEDELKKCPSVTKFVHTDGQGDTQKAISDIEGLAAQGVEAVVVYPDAGKALLPVLTKVTNAGMTTVPYWGDIGGEKGKNYTDSLFIDWRATGEGWAEWIVKALDGKGKWLYIGGTADNAQNLERREGMLRVFEEHPEIQQVGPEPYAITNWDPAQHQKQLAAALARYPDIDVVAADFGGAMASSLVAFEQANREIPAIASEDNNKLGCAAVDEGFPLFTMSTGNWIVRDAVHLAVAHATGGEVPTDLDPKQVPFEDSISGEPNKPQCDKSLSGDANLSSQLTKEQLAAAIE